MENTQLKTIIEYLETQDEKLNTLLKNNGKTNINTLNESLISLDGTIKKHRVELVTILKFIKLTKDKIVNVSETIPPKIYHQTIKFDKDSRNQVWLTIIGIIFFLSISIIIINHFNDNTNYKKAWEHILEKDLTVDQRTYFNSVLDNSN
jgi:hypothetical protein